MNFIRSRRYTVPFSVIFMSIMFAFFADIKCLNWALVMGEYVSDGVMAPLYIGTILIIVLASFFAIRFKTQREMTSSLVIFLSLIVFYFITSQFIGDPRVSLPFYSVFTLSAFIIPQIVRVDAKWVLFAAMTLPAFSITRINYIFASYLTWQDVISMDASYGYLVPIVANIAYIKFFYKENSVKMKILTCFVSSINLVFLFELFLFGSRGPLLAIMLLCIILYIVTIEEGRLSFEKKRFRVTIIASVMFVLFFFTLVSYFDDFLTNIGINSYAVQKIINMGSEGNLSNGRSELSEITWNDFLNEPIFGHGLDMFEQNHPDQPYPHNFILQILYDGGIVLFIILMVPILKRFTKKIKSLSREEGALMTFLFFSSVPGGLFSQDLWENAVLWLFIGYLFTNNIIYDNNGTSFCNNTYL